LNHNCYHNFKQSYVNPKQIQNLYSKDRSKNFIQKRFILTNQVLETSNFDNKK
jgi:hypothetical protein